MKVLQIWIDKNIPDNIKMYMQSIKNNTPNYSYFFIGENQIDEEMSKAFIRLGNKDWWKKYCTKNMYKADMVRLAWALDNPDLLYVDADVEFISPPVIPISNLPVIGTSRGFQEFFLFYTNNCSKWFEELIKITISRPPIPHIFMGVFKDIELGRCLNIPSKFNENTFYVRH
jgi:hypothetical protein